MSLELSIVIPSYNRRAALETCLRALGASHSTDFEVIVVDDGSSDDTIRMLEATRSSIPKIRLRWLRNRTNIGANHSRNRGIRSAQGRLVAFLDSDCVPSEHWVERISAPFEDGRIGSASGLVIEDEPQNVFDLTLWGMNRVRGDPDATRLVAGNLCVRRELLLQSPFDEDLKYGCDEEGLFLRLRAAGVRQVFVPAAVVHHAHRFDTRGFVRQAWLGGGGAAWLVYKYRLRPRIDVLPLILCYATLPLVLLSSWALALSALFLLAQVAALFYNDIFRMGKGVLASITTMPLLLAYYHVRVAAYVFHSIRLRVGTHAVSRTSLASADRSR